MKHRAEFLLITASMGFALGGVAAKVLREADMDAFRLTQIRSTGAGLILLAFAIIKGKDQLRARKEEIKDLLLFGIIGVAAVTSFYFFAIKYLFVSVALIIEFTASIWIALYLKFVKKKHISPIIQEKIDKFSEEIPKNLGPTITEALSVQIKNSQDQVVEALFPIIGKMIKRYIQQEIKMLSDSINEKLQSTISIKSLKRKIKSVFSGVSEKEIILSELSNPEIQQIFITIYQHIIRDFLNINGHGQSKNRKKHGTKYRLQQNTFVRLN